LTNKENAAQTEDLLLASLAGIKLCGITGQIFTLTNNNTGQVKTHTISENDEFGGSSFREKRIYVPLGTWECYTKIENWGEATLTLNADQVGYIYTFTYELCHEKITEITTSTEYTVPDIGLYGLYATACAGGGGGAGASGASSYYGGGGGAGGDCIYKKLISTTSGEKISITIGQGGSGGAVNSAGTKGSSTVIGNVITLLGGNPGTVGSRSYSGGGAAGSGGGAGGNNYSAGGDSTVLSGKGAARGSYSGSGGSLNDFSVGGGGGGAYGNGGTAGEYSNRIGGNGGIGAGGGGGAGYEVGGNGGNGIVVFYKGVIIR
jgi:hypothetical protein